MHFVSVLVTITMAMAAQSQSPSAAERFEDVAFRLSTEPDDVAIGAMALWAEGAQGDDAARAYAWMSRKLIERDRSAARAALVRAQAASPSTKAGLEALRLLAVMDLEDGRLGDARAAAAQLAASPDPVKAAAGKRIVEQVDARRQRRVVFTSLLVLLAVDVVVRLRRAGRAAFRRPLPFELLAAGPFLALFVALGAAQGVEALPALALLAAFGSLLLWARGAHRRRRPLAALRVRLLDGALAVAEAASLAWVVFEGGGLVDKLELFFLAGPA